jgi:hypothetical protein
MVYANLSKGQGKERRDERRVSAREITEMAEEARK